MYYSKIRSFGSNSIYLGNCNIYKDQGLGSGGSKRRVYLHH